MCAMVIVFMPLWLGQPIKFCRLTNRSNNDKPVITSGITRGEAIIPVKSIRPLNCLNLASINPAIVPKIVANVAVIAAILKLSKAAFKIFSLLKSSTYHLIDHPPQTVTSFESLKE